MDCPGCGEALVPAAPDLHACDACGFVVHEGCRVGLAKRCPGCERPRRSDRVALALAALGFAAASGGLFAYGWLGERSRLWPPASLAAAALAGTALYLSWGRPPAGLARGLALMGIALCYPPLVALGLIFAAIGLVMAVSVLFNPPSASDALVSELKKFGDGE
jgi:hypothetical protein